MKTRLLIPVVTLIAVLLACNAPFRATVPPIAPQRPATDTPSVVITVTVCPFVENPGPAPADLVKRAQDAFAATGLKGELLVSGEGEYTCSEFHLRSVDFEFSLDVPDLKDESAMKTLASRIKKYPVKEVLNGHNLGNFKLRFQAGGQFCWWDENNQSCGPAMPLP